MASLLALAGLASSACVSQPSAAGVPALRITTPAGKESVLIGSIHVGHADLRRPDVDALFTGARVYAVESVPGDGPPAPPDELTYGLVEDGKLQPTPWGKQLSAAEVKRFEERVACNLPLPDSTSAAQAAKVLLAMGSPQMAYAVSVRPCSPVGVLSRDLELGAAAKERGLRTVGLEFAATVAQRRREVPRDVYVQLVKHTLGPSNSQDMQRAVAALNAGDYEAILRVMDSALPSADVPSVRGPMLDARNLDWMPRLKRLLNDGGAVINVGAGHLGGPNGLIALLRASGNTVEPMYVPAARQSATAAR